MSSAAAFDKIPWYHRPDRKCVNDDRFTTLPQGRKAQDRKAELIYLCMNCPVLNECYKDAADAHAKGLIYGPVIQGGQEWR
jgi:Transcription factor WhiB.